LVDLDRHHAGILNVERPSPVLIAFRHDQIDRFRHTLLRSDPCVAQVVEAAQDVVVPPGGGGKAHPRRAALPISLDHLARRSAHEEVPLPAKAGSSYVGGRPNRWFVFEQRLEHADRRVEGGPGRAVLRVTIPTAIRELFVEQTVYKAADIPAKIGTSRRHLTV